MEELYLLTPLTKNSFYSMRASFLTIVQVTKSSPSIDGFSLTQFFHPCNTQTFHVSNHYQRKREKPSL
jgi:hypothetical protein